MRGKEGWKLLGKRGGGGDGMKGTHVEAQGCEVRDVWLGKELGCPMDKIVTGMCKGARVRKSGIVWERGC